MKRIAAVLLVAMAGCATEAGYQQMLQGWVGAPEVDLVRQWGTPAGSYETGGVKFITYRSGRNIYMPGTPGTATTQLYGNTAYTTTTPGVAPMNIAMNCETTFEIREGKVSSWRWQGNDCKAKPR